MGSVLNFVFDDVMVKKEFYWDYFNNHVPLNSEYNLVNIMDIDHNNNENYFYITTSNLNLEDQLINFGGLPLSNRVIDCLKNNEKFNVIFFMQDEADQENALEILDLFISNYNLNSNQFYLINLNEKLIELKRKNDSKINVYTINKLKKIFSFEMSNFDVEFLPNKDYLFSCYNRASKFHRLFILCFLKKYNIIDDTDWSWLRGDIFRTIFENVNFNYNDMSPYFLEKNVLETIYEELKYFVYHKTKKSVFEENLNIDIYPNVFNWHLAYMNNTYKNSYINIVNESTYENKNLVLISEKTLIPLYFNQIPIIVSNPHHIRKLKQYEDFDFFDDLVDHRYDDEEDPQKRMLMIVGEIRRLRDNKEKVVDFYKNNENRFIENRKKIIKMKDYHKKDAEFFSNLKNK